MKIDSINLSLCHSYNIFLLIFFKLQNQKNKLAKNLYSKTVLVYFSLVILVCLRKNELIDKTKMSLVVTKTASAATVQVG